MVDCEILDSEWVVPKKNGWGYELKPDAPADVAIKSKEFEEAYAEVEGK